MPFSVAILLVSKHFILIFIIGLIYSVSHDVLQLNSIKTIPWKRSIVDNLSHISLGIVSWFVAISYEKVCQPWNIGCSLLCGFFAGFVDIDHFLMAKSLKLRDALNLPSRPPFHNSTLMFACILIFIFTMHATAWSKAAYIGWIMLVAVISHHLRDSLHRGLWLWPVHTKPVERITCLILTYCFPLFIGVIINLIYRPQKYLIVYDNLQV